MLTTKEEWRKIYQKKRKALTEHDWVGLNEQLMSRALLLVDMLKPRYIHTFLPIKKNKEPNTYGIVDAIQKKYPHIQWIVPRMVENSHEMEHYLLSSSTILIKNKWGIIEPDPASTLCIDPIQIDLIFTPLLVIDQAGYRIGYGGGYYDRFFPRCRPDVNKVGLSIFSPVTTSLPRDTYDIPLDFCIAPDNIWSFKQINS